MSVPWGTATEILTLLADRLAKKDVGTLSIGADAADRAAGRAYNDVRGVLLARQYAAAQIELWDRRAEFFFDLCTFYLMADLAVKGGAGLDAIKVYDRRPELDKVTVTIGGVVVLPGSSAPDSPGATVGYGPIRRPAEINPVTGYPYDRQPRGWR